jgi:alpha-tubulin suppressor-like RCC1 family protein
VYYKGNVVFSLGINAPSCVAPHGKQQLSGHITPEMAGARLIRPVPPTVPIRVSIGLPVSVPLPPLLPLQAFAQDVSNPNSPNYRHYKTEDDFVATYGATTDAYRQLKSWATGTNLLIGATYRSNLLLTVSGTAAAIEQALFINLNYYQRPDGSQFYAPDREPSLDVDTAVLHISALDDFIVAKPAAYAPSGSYTPGNLYTAKDIRQAYGCTGLDGKGQVLGLFENVGYDDTHLATDVTAYKAASGIASNTNITQCNLYDSTDGWCAKVPSHMPEDFGPSETGLELAADVDMALAMAPGLSDVVIIEDTVNNIAGVLHAVADGDMNGKKINQFSISYGIGLDKNVEVALMQLSAQGQSVFRSTTDQGALPLPAQCAAAGSPCQYSFECCNDCIAGRCGDLVDPLLTFAGGTQLMLTGGLTEEVWATGIIKGLYVGAGCGSWAGIALPRYQQMMPWNWADLGGQTQWRNIPDVSMVARDVLVCWKGDGTCIGPSGTSLSAPLWAAFTALANEQLQNSGKTVGFANPTIYAIGNSPAYGANFNDVPFGSSVSNGGTQIYYTQTGFDIPTGWGSPKCALASQLASSSPAPNRAVTASEFHSCAIRNDNSVSCWGATKNNFGQIGNGSTLGSPSPVPVSNLTGASAGAGNLYAGQEQTCVVMNDTTVRCWGRNNLGMLGNNSTIDSATPVTVSQLSGATAVTTAETHSCALLGDGTVKCWGYNDIGQLGNNSTTSSLTPVDVPNLSQVTAIAANGYFTCALISTGEVKCWGDNQSGELGNGPPGSFNSLVPVSVLGISNATAIGTGYTHACAVLADSTVMCWGSNYEGCLGNGTATDSNVPVAVLSSDASTPLTGAITVSAGMQHSCALMSDSTVTCWGRDVVGQLGDSQSGFGYRPYAGPVTYGPDYLVNVAALASGYYHNCALLKNGNIVCWGINDEGELGDGTTIERDSASPVFFY